MRKENESYEVRQARREMEKKEREQNPAAWEEFPLEEDVWAEKNRREGRKKKPVKKKRRRSGCFSFVWRVAVFVFLLAFLGMCLLLRPVSRVPLDKERICARPGSLLYKTVVLYGLDSRDGEISGGVRSDVIMIASINRITGHTKFVSVYRDTFLQTQEGNFSKINAGYNGGPGEAVAMLNRNLDLGITDYVTVNFNSLAEIIDALGGVEISVKPEEVPEINSFLPGTAKVIGQDPVYLSEAGLQTLSGVQAVTYARIRSTAGDDFRRAYRQRNVLEAILQKAKHAGARSLVKASSCLTKNVQTSFSLPVMSLWALRAPLIKVDIMTGFPFAVTTSETISGYAGSYVIPVGLRENVIKLHEILYGEKNYTPSEKVDAISGEIETLSGVSSGAGIPEVETEIYTKTR